MNGYTLHAIREDGTVAESMNFGNWVTLNEAVDGLKWRNEDAIAVVNGYFEPLWEHPEYTVEVA